MHCHLVTVEVSVKRSADERMNLNGLTFNQDRFKGLDAESVQCRSTIQKNWMLLDHRVENLPDLWSPTLNHSLR